ncbi:hypothetical protein LTR10_021688 [Elasticomyces elasticus]|nr:hypothetical protein LTR10_021688 [Elasticomyces elasticus]KAK5021133.1 hypothetical protein LTS07_011220 [Exophiala sideris]KAK5023744.1 hypothetical protein LTR13_011122 [Exophiala sideris]
MEHTSKKMEMASCNHDESTHAMEAVSDHVKVDGGVLLQVGTENVYHLKLAKDGHTVLVPQPSDDPDDPLLWSSFRKHAVLFTLAYGAFTTDFASGSGTSLIVAQGEQWGMNPNDVNHANNISILLLGVSALIFVPLSTFWGRAPVIFWSAVIAWFLSLGIALSPTWSSYYPVRVLGGVFWNAPPSISIAFLRDIFFFHESARKIGFWTVLFISSPYWGPLFANFMLAGLGDWRPPLWLVCAMQGVFVLSCIAFLDETWYNRDIPLEQQPRRGQSFLDRMWRITGLWQVRHHNQFFGLRRSVTRFVEAFLKPVLLIVYFNYFIAFGWAIGINVTTAVLFATPEAYGGYGYNYRQLGFLYFTPVVGVFLGELIGHYANDALVRLYVKRHKGIFEPEVRLWMAYLAALFMIVGLVLLGQGFYHHLNIGVLIIGWGLQTCGMVILSVTTFTYAVDSYPTAPAESAGWISFIRVAGGFSVAYYQQPWGEKIGYNNSFGIQAALVGFGTLLVMVAHKFGHRLRINSGTIR